MQTVQFQMLGQLLSSPRDDRVLTRHVLNVDVNGAVQACFNAMSLGLISRLRLKVFY